MDEEIFDDGRRRLKVSIAGIDHESGTVSAEDFRLTVYAFETEPSVKALFTERLTLEQAARLHKFLDSLSLVRDASKSVSGRLIEVDCEIPDVVIGALLGNPQLASDPGLVRAVLTMSPELCRTVIETEVTAFDLSCLAYRRAQLDTMSALLADEAAFAKYQAQVGAEGKEAAWQAFFEKNQWILGYALNYIIGEGVQPSKLEQVVAGYSIAGAGKRVDALLHTRGVIRSLCYLEIKTHETPLLHGTEYRPDVWRPSNELAGAVAQSQKTVQLAAQHLQTKYEVPVSAGQSGGDRFFNYAPRAIVVCGHLREFATPNGIDDTKFSSFELYRRSFHSPEIITFDELHDRARAIVEARLVAKGVAPTAQSA